ncbi:MAG: glycosyltransferase family 39 protein [Bdellovibrionales bacterium]|nr:glycosyltransferase family 39 protein [Bdellovibrionales bacterium]
MSLKLRPSQSLWIVVLGLVTFFGTWSRPGLQPDAALYAGLAQKILATGEAWKLSGSDGFFPLFAEHPPYFFQWGAQVLDVLGTSDGAARAIGGIFGFTSFLLASFWAGRRFGSSVGLWTAFILATFGHFTKFAATSMLEAPLSLGTLMAAIGVYEFVRDTEGLQRRSAALLMFCGLFMATAAKGVAGLGAWGGVALTLAFSSINSSRLRHRWGFNLLILLGTLTVCLAPLGLWAARMYALGHPEWIHEYFVHQVLRSAASTRGDASHLEGGSVFFYCQMLVLNGWPWWWTVPACWFFQLRRSRGFPRSPALAQWSICSFLFAFAFIVPFSLVKFQLAHYIHPVYLPLAPVGAVFLSTLFRRTPKHVELLRWSALVVAGVVVVVISRRAESFPNRGQEFREIAAEVIALPPNCSVVVADNAMDPYRMESFALWYWRGRTWKILSAEDFARHQAYPLENPQWAAWVPEYGILRTSPACAPRIAP